MVMLSTLSLQGVVAAGTGNTMPINIAVVVIVLVAAIASVVSLKKS